MWRSNLLDIDTVTRTAEDQAGSHRLCKSSGLVGLVTCFAITNLAYLGADLFLILFGKADKMIVLGANQERDSSLVEASPLPIPLLDAVECALPCQIEHEQDGNGIIAHEWQHVDKLSLTSEIPDGEGDFCVSDRDGLFHEIDT